VISLEGGHETIGKLTFKSGSIHVEGASASEIDLKNVLEANFTDNPFHLDYFSSVGDTSTPLPKGWSEKIIGPAVVPGSVSYAAGEFTLTGNQRDPVDEKDQSDRYFVTGLSWTGDGQWTVRAKSMDSPSGGLQGGFMLRESLDPLSAMIGTAASNWGLATMFVRYSNHSTSSHSAPMDNLPVWLRLTRRGPSVDFEVSDDRKHWSLVGLSTPKFANSVWAGLFINSHEGMAVQKVVFDQILFTPAPGPAPGRIVSPGVLLSSGSFLAGYFDAFDFTSPSPIGKFIRNGNDLSLSPSKAAAAIYHPVKRSQFTEIGSQTGVILQNDDFLAGTFNSINVSGVSLDSIQMGHLDYNLDQICACTFDSVHPLDAEYEVRLKDGSDIRAKSLSLNNEQFSIEEVSGINVIVGADEIAQFRAGTSRVQSLLDSAWKVASSPSPSAPPVGNSPSAPDNKTLPAESAPPATPPAADPSPSVECWSGNDQEQMMVDPAGTAVDFPLTGKVRALAMRVALSPDSPPDSQATIRILADGKEIAHTPPFKAGDQPRFVQVALSNPKTLTLVADSDVAETRILFIDPVAIRASTK
jgi:hypothetical protein